MENLLRFVKEHEGDEISRLILDRKKYQGIDIDLAVNCIESRRKLKGKVQQWYDEPSLIFPLKLSAEQCSSSATGKYKADVAARIAGKEDWRIADLTGGLGVDSWFFSQRASAVTYNEMQTVLCDAARHNFRILGAENIVISNTMITAGGCLDFLKEIPDIIYMDPARRGAGGKKVFLIEDCTPDILTLKNEIFRQVRHILVKLSPMADISMVCERLGSTCREVHVVGSGGECKELLIWMDRDWNGEYTIIAAELDQDGNATTFSFQPSEEKDAGYAGCQELSGAKDSPTYLFEPGKALMKAGAFNLMASRFGMSKMGRSTHYYITDSTEKAGQMLPYGKVFMILECGPLDKRNIKETGKKYPKAEVTARNIPMDTDTLRKKTGIASGDDAHIFGLKSDAEGNLLIVARRIRS